MPGQLTNFPNGISSFGIPIMGSNIPSVVGTVYWVGSAEALATDGVGAGASGDKPFATLAYALTIATTAKNDMIILMPGHAETITADMTISLNDLVIIALGTGARRPTINVAGGTGIEIIISGDNITIHGLRVTGGIDAIAEVIDITGDNINIRDLLTEDVTGQALIWIRLDTADGAHIDGWTHRGATAAGTVSALVIDNSDDVVIEDFDLRGNFSAAAITFVDAASTNVRIFDGHIETLNSVDLGITDIITACTGQIGPDIYIVIADDAANVTEAVVGATFYFFDPIIIVNAVNQRGLQWNGTAVADS